MKKVLLCLVGLALVLGMNAYGQSNLATVTGVVTDVGDAVIPGATVTVRNVDTNIDRVMQTNEVGVYTITNLQPGNYELTAESEGFRK
ncbi:MAG: carboxypeptidase regulatory-like domain-containing protein [bacterium]|nr:carboxypeptidase regulatory-like domain-containing protein [bacterium]